jgi:hypothetical protein
MKKIFFVLLMAFSCSSWAEWQFLGETEGETDADAASIFFDATSIKKEGEIRRVWAVSNKNNASTRHLLEYNCKKEQVRFLSSSSFSQPMAQGTLLDGNNVIGSWSYIAPRTIHELLLTRVCSK